MEREEEKKPLDWTGCAIDRELWDQFKTFAWANGIAAKKLMEEILRDYLRRQGVDVPDSRKSARFRRFHSVEKA